MSSLLNIITGWPTVVYSVLLSVALLYWLLGIIGLVDHHHGIDFDHGGLEIHGDMHGDLHGDVQAEGDHLPTAASYVVAFGLSGVPLSLVLTLLAIFAWTATALATQYVLPLVPESVRALAGILVLALALIPAIFFTALFSKPLRRIFASHPAPSHESLIGLRCRVTTLKVTESFGQGEVANRGASYNIKISAREPNKLCKGAMAAIVSYDHKTQRFLVQPDDEG